MGATHFTGPVITGDLDQGQVGGPNKGFIESYQDTVILNTGAGTTDTVLNIPAGSVIMGFEVATFTAWNSATSSTLTIGNVAGGAQYVGATDLKAAAPFPAMTQSAANVAAQRGYTAAGVPAPVTGPIFIRVVNVGAGNAGAALVSVHYVQTTSSS
jgi:hypothetical protein